MSWQKSADRRLKSPAPILHLPCLDNSVDIINFLIACFTAIWRNRNVPAVLMMTSRAAKIDARISVNKKSLTVLSNKTKYLCANCTMYLHNAVTARIEFGLFIENIALFILTMIFKCSL